MGFPNLRNKHAKDSIFSASEFIAYQKKQGKYPKFKPPVGVIFCYLKSLEEFYGEMYLVNETNGKVAVIGEFGISAPVVAALLEEMIAFEVKKIISIGTAGTLQKNIKISSLMVCEKAIRDEKTSLHYLKHSKYAYASKEMTNKIKKSLEKFEQKILLEQDGQLTLLIGKELQKPNNIKKKASLLLKWKFRNYLLLLNIEMLILERYSQLVILFLNCNGNLNFILKREV